jgi:hypothetical protein
VCSTLGDLTPGSGRVEEVRGRKELFVCCNCAPDYLQRRRDIHLCERAVGVLLVGGI